MRVGSVCTGYGGLDLALTHLWDTTTAWVADIEQGPRRVLAHRYPDAPNLGDVTAVDWAGVEAVDVICGGTPCQDLSTAGRRAGMTDSTRSGLWASMLAAVTTLRPPLVIWENVLGSLSAPASSSVEPQPGTMARTIRGGAALRAAGRVAGDLATAGYDAQWLTAPASTVDAPHRRERVFLLAHDPAAPHAKRLLRDRARSPRHRRPQPPDRRRRDSSTRWGRYAPAIHRWEQSQGPAPSPVDPDRERPRLSPRFVEWMMGLPTGWVTDVPGVTRAQALRMLGNGVVPQQAAHALDALAGWALHDLG